MSASTQKILICGDVDSQFDLLMTRLTTLQNSAAGPFHVLFIVGPLFKNEEEFLSVTQQNKLTLILPTYIYDVRGVPKQFLNNTADLPNNLHILQMNTDSNIHDYKESGIGIATINNLTVAYCKNTNTNDSTLKQSYEYVLKNIINTKSYRGCDLFLTNEWPSDCHQFLETELLISSGISFGASSSFVSNAAMAFRPRYHCCIGKNIYFQRPPYTNRSSQVASNNGDTTASASAITHHQQNYPCTRVIGLAKVSEVKDKEKKYLHALSLTPIIHMSANDLADTPIGSTDCPYVPISSSKSITSGGGSNIGNKHELHTPMNGGSNKRIKVDPSESNRGRFDSIDTSPVPGSGTAGAASGASGGAFFFGSMGATRPPPPPPGSAPLISATGVLPTSTYHSNSSVQLAPASKNVKTLFISGLGSIHRHITDANILSELPDSTRVHRPEGKSFMFVEFLSHEAAQAIMTSCSSSNSKSTSGNANSVSGMTLCDRQVTVGWGKEKASDSTTPAVDHATGSTNITTNLVAPSNECKTLFVGNLNPLLVEGDITMLFTNIAHTHHLQLQQSKLNIFKPSGKSYAFVDFATVQEASDIMSVYVTVSSVLNTEIQEQTPATDTSTTTATIKPPPPPTVPPPQQSPLQLLFTIKGSVVRLGWAKGYTPGNSNKSLSNTHNNDCWFCLASSTIKTHLIVSIGEYVYVAMPRGAITNDHLLVIPIDCVSSRIMFSEPTKLEFMKYLTVFSRFFEEQSVRKYPFLFERTLKTRGKDHMQTNIVPLTQEQCKECLNVFFELCRKHDVTFMELESNSEDIDDVVLNPAHGPYQEYFYIQIPTPSLITSASRGQQQSKSSNDGDTDAIKPFRHFIFIPSSASTSNNTMSTTTQPSALPLSFGLEVAAQAIGQPERSFWKNCLLNEHQEEELTEQFKTKFETYDFNIN